MSRESLSIATARQVPSHSLVTYAEGMGWRKVPNVRRSDVVVLQSPESPLHQVIIPNDPELVDFGEAVIEAVQRLAEFERRPGREVLEHLLLPPADVLRFRTVSADAEGGNLPFEHAVRMINGTRRLLLSAAHSVLAPRPYHPRLSRSEAEEFVSRCRMGQTERGSFVLNVACPLEPQLSLPWVAEHPFARKVTALLIQSLESLAGAAAAARVEGLFDPALNPGISANLCESLLLLRPIGDRASLTVSATWSRALIPASREPSRQVKLTQGVFDVAEAVAPSLRTEPTPRPARFLGYVDVLSGQPSRDNPRPSGEVDFTLFDDEEGEIRARGALNADDYAAAASAHLASAPVAFKATLRRLPRVSRLDRITDFDRVRFDAGVPTGGPGVPTA